VNWPAGWCVSGNVARDAAAVSAGPGHRAVDQTRAEVVYER